MDPKQCAPQMCPYRRCALARFGLQRRDVGYVGAAHIRSSAMRFPSIVAPRIRSKAQES
jgi:hypothetical protein